MTAHSSVYCNIYLLALVTQAGSQQCGVAWFGTNCSFHCNCVGQPCGALGDCLGWHNCVNGWFHTACQYSDVLYLLKDSSVEKILADSSDVSCLADTTLTQVRLDFVTPVHVSWVRLVGSATAEFTLSLKAEDKLAQLELAFNERGAPCTNGRRYNASMTAVDIECDVLEPVSTILVKGAAVGFLCNVYVSGGQNLALLQQTSLSTTGVRGQVPVHHSYLAVDGIIGEFTRCARSSQSSTRNQTFRLTFNYPVVLTHIVLYTSFKDRVTSAKFHLVTLDTNDSVIERYINLETVRDSYFILLNETKKTVHSILITASNNLGLVEICELQAFGARVCDHGLYGFECADVCSCPNNKCAAHSGACALSCVTGYFGPSCNESCSENCNPPGVCDHDDGACSSCAAGYLGSKCEEECAPGTYGQGCSNSCSSRCKDRLCNASTGNCQSCSNGFYGPTCENNCPVNCDNQSCDPAGLCFQCRPGFFGSVCSTACAGACRDRRCDMNDGHCDVCDGGYHGSKCTSLCPVHCSDKKCDRVTGNCHSCRDGFFRQDCSTPCPANCGDAPCDMYNGSCGEDCVRGYFGSQCSIMCPHRCTDGKCHKLTGLCLACENHYGTFCLLECPKTCANRTCGRQTGHCQYCQRGHFGFHCSQTCPVNCADNLCNIKNGNCDSCIPGRYGRFCNKTCLNECSPSPCYTGTAECVRGTSKGSDTYIYVTVASVAAVLTTVLLLLCQRKNREDADEEDDEETSEDSGYMT